MAIYGTGYGPGLAPWWQGHTDQFTGQQEGLGRGPSELDVRKTLDAISNQRDFSSMGGGMFSRLQQGVPVATTPVGQPVPIAEASMQPAVMPSVQPVTNNVAPQVTQMNSNMGAPMTSAVMPPSQPAAPMPQSDMLNQNFMQLLQGLGLNNLFQSFQPYIGRQGAGSTGLFGIPQNFGMAPNNTGYLPPLITNPTSSVASTGMLNQIY